MTKGRFRTVLGLNALAGYIEPIGDTPLYFNDRFYLGGENSVRGFKYRSIWVRDSEGNTVTDQSGFPLGGNRSIQLNIEAIFVLKGPFRFLIYTDGGRVYGDDQSFDFENFRISGRERSCRSRCPCWVLPSASFTPTTSIHCLTIDSRLSSSASVRVSRVSQECEPHENQ